MQRVARSRVGEGVAGEKDPVVAGGIDGGEGRLVDDPFRPAQRDEGALAGRIDEHDAVALVDPRHPRKEQRHAEPRDRRPHEIGEHPLAVPAAVSHLEPRPLRGGHCVEASAGFA